MALDTSLAGIRSTFLTSIFGRRLALDPNEFLIGPKDHRTIVEGVSSAGSTIVSTSVAANLSNYGVSLVGATGASATTAYILAAPMPGVRKLLYNPTSGNATVLTTASGAFMASTASNALVSAKLNALGAYVELVGLTTNLWGVVGVSQISTGGIGVTFA